MTVKGWLQCLPRHVKLSLSAYSPVLITHRRYFLWTFGICDFTKWCLTVGSLTLLLCRSNGSEPKCQLKNSVIFTKAEKLKCWILNTCAYGCTGFHSMYCKRANWNHSTVNEWTMINGASRPWTLRTMKRNCEGNWIQTFWRLLRSTRVLALCKCSGLARCLLYACSFSHQRVHVRQNLACGCWDTKCSSKRALQTEQMVRSWTRDDGWNVEQSGKKWMHSPWGVV